MNRLIPPVSAVFLTLVLCACGDGSSAQPTPAPNGIQALENSGAIPKLERGPTVEGVDANGNGIRDDIDQFIERNYATEPQRQAARQLAKYLQQALVIDKQNRAALKENSVRGMHAVHCTFIRFDGANGSKHAAKVVDELEAVTTNTKARLLAYLAYNKALDGTSSALPEEDTCE